LSCDHLTMWAGGPAAGPSKPPPARALALGACLTTGLIVLGAVLAAGPSVGVGAAEAIVLLLVSLLASRIDVRLSDRMAYSPTLPVVVLAGLVGGPLLGAAAGAVTAVPTRARSWSPYLVWGSVATLQGVAAGLIGKADASVAAKTTAAIGVAMAVGLATDLLVARLRRIRGSDRAWTQLVTIAALEVGFAFPLVALVVSEFERASLLALGAVGAGLAAVALAENTRRRYVSAVQDQHALARRDTVTGAPNRLAMQEAIALEHERVARGAAPAGLFLADLDRFKWVNERYGYAVGDAVLRELVARLAAGMRTIDLVARWGGEEVVVLTPALAPSALGVVAEKLRRLVRDRPFELAGECVAVTVSVGGVLLDASSTPEAALAKAERALKRAKHDRDTAVVEGSLDGGARSNGRADMQVDALTGLLNRQALTELVLQRETERALRLGQPLALLWIDLDGFQPVNERLGHAAGDAVLAGVADTIAAVLGREDLVFRTGGDEFAAVLPVDQPTAERIAEELRAGIARRAFPTRNGGNGQSELARFSATIGLGWIDGSLAGDPDLYQVTQTLLAAANDACMAGKRQGCDRVVSARARPGE
jgi:diguanylate cyclase (GGDEF)-like protein